MKKMKEMNLLASALHRTKAQQVQLCCLNIRLQDAKCF